MKQSVISRKFKGLALKVCRFNDRLKEIQRLCGTDEVYLDKTSTCIGSPEKVSFLSCEVYADRFYACQVTKKGLDYWHVTINKDEDGEEYFEGAYEFVRDIEFMRKCIENGLKFYQSEDPDRFLESDGDEDE